MEMRTQATVGLLGLHPVSGAGRPTGTMHCFKKACEQAELGGWGGGRGNQPADDQVGGGAI